MKFLCLLVCIWFFEAYGSDSVPAEDNSPRTLSLFQEGFNLLHHEPFTSQVSTKAKASTKWIDQKLDNFDDKNEEKWRMRYLVNDNYYEKGGPIFIYVGGEWQISASNIESGIFVDIAKEHKGILFYTEHRFYGKSRPTTDIRTANLKYLNVKQALADLAHFIRTVRKEIPGLANSKVIMAGGSYAASMVVWFKKLYPNLLAGGWASSAPVNAKLNFAEYYEIVGKAITELGNEECYRRIENGTNELERMVRGTQAADVKAMLKLCNNFDDTNDLDVWNLFNAMSVMFAGLVQYQKEGEVAAKCKYLSKFDTDVEALSQLFLQQFKPSKGCIDATYKDGLNHLLDAKFTAGSMRPWFYQTCNEFGWYQTSTSKSQPFGTHFPLMLYTALCSNLFGKHFNAEFVNNQIQKTNRDFGGFRPEVENVYMTQGAFDPWHPMGNGTQGGATVIPNVSHCADFDSISDRDSKEMIASKQRLITLVKQWLS